MSLQNISFWIWLILLCLKINLLLFFVCVCVLQHNSDSVYVFHSKQWKQRLQEKYQWAVLLYFNFFFFYSMTNHVMCKLHKIKAAVYSYKLQMCIYWFADCRFLCCIMYCMCFCFVKRWSTQLRLTWREEEALVFVFRTIMMTLILASWACHLPNPSVILWNCL